VEWRSRRPRVPCEQRAVAIFHAVLAAPANLPQVYRAKNAHADLRYGASDVAADPGRSVRQFRGPHHRIFDVELGVGGYCLSRYRSFRSDERHLSGRNGRRHCCR
jgi:hypothetical protein